MRTGAHALGATSGSLVFMTRPNLDMLWLPLGTVDGVDPGDLHVLHQGLEDRLIDLRNFGDAF